MQFKEEFLQQERVVRDLSPGASRVQVLERAHEQVVEQSDLVGKYAPS